MIVNPHLSGEPFLWQAGPVGVLLVHGFTATTAEIQPLAETLYSAGYTVSGPLLPGHGSSPEQLNKTKWQEWVQAVEQAYTQLSSICNPVIVGGESTGGLLSLYLAAKHPEIIALLLYAPALKLNYSTFNLIRLRLLAPFIPWVPKQNPNSNPLWQGYRVNPLKGVIQLLELQRVVRSTLPLITQPILIVQGKKDPTIHHLVPKIIVESVQSQIKEVHWMEASTHCVAIDCEMVRVGQITTKFLQRVLITPE